MRLWSGLTFRSISQIWLGSAFLGFEAAQAFNPTFGPILMVAFAILSQTLRELFFRLSFAHGSLQY